MALWLACFLPVLAVGDADIFRFSPFCSSSDANSCTGRQQTLAWYFHAGDPLFDSPRFRGYPPDYTYFYAYNEMERFKHLADLDQDGLVDLLYIDPSVGNITFSKRMKNHSLAAAVVLANIAPAENWGKKDSLWMSQLQAVDWDLDGDLDLFIFNSNGYGQTLYLEQLSQGAEMKFAVRHNKGNPAAAVNSTGPVQVLDWDQDGDFDILYAEGNWGKDVWEWYHKALVPRFGFLENMGAGDLRPRDGAQNPMNGFHATNRVLSVHAADWDGDGDSDLLVWEMVKDYKYEYDGQLVHYEQLQGGSFLRREPMVTFRVGHFHSTMQVVDWTADGLSDVRLGPFLLNRTFSEGFLQWNELSPWASVGLSKDGLTFVDWDGNGVVDILDAGSNSNGSIRYFQAGADGSYLQQVDFPAVAANAVVGAGDWDGDGDADLIVQSPDGLRFYERVQDDRGPLVERLGAENPFRDVMIKDSDPDDYPFEQIQMVDVDSDKRTDLLLMNGERGKLVFWQQQQDGSLSNRGDLVNFTYSPGRCQFYPDQSRHSAIVLDYNHDGILDVLVKQTRWYYGMGSVSICEGTAEGRFASASELFQFPPDKYPNALRAIPCWGTSDTCFVLDTDLWSRGFCKKEDACAGRGACGFQGCFCAEGYSGDCSTCSSGYYAANRLFGSQFVCSRCAGDSQVCAQRGLCDDDATQAYKARTSGSNVTSRLVMGTGSCTCSEVHFGGTDDHGRVDCATGTCPGGSQATLREKVHGGEIFSVYECEACPAGTASRAGGCVQCAPGSAARNGSSECAACSAGRYMAAHAAADCLDCPAGTWSKKGQNRCTECQPGKASLPGSSECFGCPPGHFVGSTGATACLECPAGTMAGEEQSYCSTCGAGMISSRGQSKCEVCASTVWVMTSDVGHLQCQVDPQGIAFLALLILTVFACCYLLLSSFTFSIRISDLSLVKGKAVLTMNSSHRILRWHWNRPAVKLRETGVPHLDSASTPFFVTATDGKRMELFDGDDCEKRFSTFTVTSMGRLTLDFPAFWWNVGLLGLPSAVWMVFFIALGIWSSFRVQPLMQCVASVLVILAVAALFAWKRNFPSTSIASARRRFAKQLLEENPRPATCERGPGRALLLGQLREFYDFFSAFIQERSMYYVCSNLVIPLTEPFKLSYAELVGCQQVTWFVSHYWGMPLRHTIDAVASHANSRQAICHMDGYWICTFSNNQWQIPEELGGGDWRDSSFFKALRSTTCRGTLMIIDEEVFPLQRAWCLFEVLQTVLRSHEDEGFRGFSLGTSSGVLNEGGFGTDLCMVIAEKLARLDLRDARASNPDDEAMIRYLVETMSGGFDAMNEFIRTSIHDALLSVRARFDQDFQQVLASLEHGHRGTHADQPEIPLHGDGEVPARV